MAEVVPLPRQGTVEDVSPTAGDEMLTSVTTIIGTIDKPALVPWAVNETADRLIANPAHFQWHLENEGPVATRKWISGLRFRTDGRLSASQLGTVAHGLFDTYALTGSRPAVTPDLHPDASTKGASLVTADVVDLRRMVDQFDRFLSEFQPEYLATEVVVFHRDFAYAGQADAFVTIDGMRFIADYKTSANTYTGNGKVKGPYPEVALQLAAYRFATDAAVWRVRRTERMRRRYYLLSAAEREQAVPVPEVEGGIAIYLTPDHYGVHAVRCDEDVHRVYLNLQEVARWSHDWADSCIGNPMVAPNPLPPPADDPFAGLPME